MVLNSRLFLSLICILLIHSCVTPPPPPEKESKNQLVIVIDKSASVTYENKISNIQSELKRIFNEVYGKSSEHIMLSKFVINGDTRIFPEPVRFNIPCPNPYPESRSEVEALQNWKIEKAKWMSARINETVSLIKKPPYSSSTDIFAIFSGLEQVQRVDGPWDAIKVLVFSDMINTANGRNMKQGLTEGNAFNKGKEECKELISQGSLSKKNIDNLYITIYTPDQMPESGIISAFWKGFFDEWGLPEEKYHFEY
jgi:hypothetical protein